MAFARAVADHDPSAFASFLHPGAIFNAGTAELDRGRDAVLKNWAPIIDGTTVALRWRAGIVHIGGEPGVAVSRGPYILERAQSGGPPSYRVGTFQTVWVRGANEGAWRVLFDGSASASQPMSDRAAADEWVAAQAMSDCGG